MSSTSDVQKWIKEAMAKKGINKYLMDVSGSSLKGDGYLGEITFVKVVADLGKGREKNYDMVIKSAKNNEQLRKTSPIAETYLREIYMYTQIFPAIDNFQKDYAIENSFTNYPECLASSITNKKESLVLQNLKSLEFVIHDRTVPHNLEHALLVFRTYAKWHGASLALKTKEPELFKNITKNMTDIFGQFLTNVNNMLTYFENYYQKGLEFLRKNNKHDAAVKIEKAANNVLEILAKMTVNDDLEADKEAVILHGDCWNNNMMFKYRENETAKPVDMVFIDFQLSRVASLVLDLSYYFYATAEKSTLDKLDYLLEEYHKGLTNYLQQYDINCDTILTLKRLKSSWRKYGRFGLIMAPFIIRTELCKDNEVVDFMQEIGDGTLDKIPVEDIGLQKEYEKRVSAIRFLDDINLQQTVTCPSS